MTGRVGTGVWVLVGVMVAVLVGVSEGRKVQVGRGVTVWVAVGVGVMVGEGVTVALGGRGVGDGSGRTAVMKLTSVMVKTSNARPRMSRVMGSRRLRGGVEDMGRWQSRRIGDQAAKGWSAAESSSRTVLSVE